MDGCKLWVLAHVFKCEHILYLVNLEDICIFSHLIMRSWLGILVGVLSPRYLFKRMQYFQNEFEFFTNLNPYVSPVVKPGSWFVKYMNKNTYERMVFGKILKKDTSQDWSWTALSIYLSTEITEVFR